MKVLLIALNARYFHTNPAVRILAEYCKGEDIDIQYQEYTINDNRDYVLEQIALYNSDVVGFSCYIWNIEFVLYLCENLKKIRPGVKIVLGGPEVSYGAEELLSRYDFIDFIVAGEGEESFKRLLEDMAHGDVETRDEIKGTIIYPSTEYVDLDRLPFAYDIEEDYSNRYIYYETSRGCPFGCSYCLSSRDRVVRYADLQKVKEDLYKIASSNVEVVKLVDRSFNCDVKRAVEIFNIIRELPRDVVFHCEVNPELVSDEFIDAVKGLEHRLQFEAGLQTTNPDSLKAINRSPRVDKALYGIKRLVDTGIKVHADLIAGLPYDTYETFSRSFDDLYVCGPDEIQLGFLKLLKGTPLRDMAEEYGMVYRSQPPYEILYNKWMSYEDLCVLKGIEALVNKYYNTGSFKYTLDYCISRCKSPFAFYEDFSRFWTAKGYYGKNLSLVNHYRLLYEYLQDCIYNDEKRFNKSFIDDIIKFDYMLKNNTTSLPDFMNLNADKKDREYIKAILRDKKWLEKNIPELAGRPMADILKCVTFEKFYHNVPESDESVSKYVVFIHGLSKSRYVDVYPCNSAESMASKE